MSITTEEFPYTPEQLAWLDDLETTSAPQGIGYLHKDDAFCCLGRACVTLGIPAEYERYAREGLVTYGSADNVLPQEAAMRLQLRGEIGTFKGSLISGDLDALDDLTMLNDYGKYTFKEIAAYIQSDPTNVFTNLDVPSEVSP